MTVTSRQSRFLEGVSLNGLGAGEDASKAAKIESFGKLSGEVDKMLLETAVDLAALIELGGATCKDVDEYNAQALSIYKANLAVFSGLLRAGADRSLLLSPFQPAFFTVNGGVTESPECPRAGNLCQQVAVKSPCSGGRLPATVAINSDSRYREFFSSIDLSVPQGLNGLGALPVAAAILWGIAILTAGTAAVLLTPKVLGFFDGSTADRATADLTDARKRLATASFKARRECIEAGGKASECTAITGEAFKAPAGAPGFLSRVVGTSFKLGAMFLAGSFVFKKIQGE